MPRVRRRGPDRRRPQVSLLSDSDLLTVTIGAPGKVETTDAPGETWEATPRDGAEANRLLTERGYWQDRGGDESKDAED